MAIICKSPAEVRIMERNSQILVSAIDSIEPLIRAEVATSTIDKAISELIASSGGAPAFKGYYDYPAATCININEEIANTIPSARQIRNGDLVKLQVGMVKDGYFTKIQHAYAIGDLHARRSRLRDATKAALWAGISQARVGNHIDDISHAIQQVAESAGFDVVREWLGHGIGTRLHEEPQVPGYSTGKPGAALRQGMVLQILPLIVERGAGERVGDDHWGATTADGRDSCLMGHVVAIEADGPHILTFSGRDHYLDETPSQAICIMHADSALRVFPLDDLGIHSVTSPTGGATIICGSAQVIQKRSGGFLRSQIEDFEALINKSDIRESELQRFFELNPSFLLGSEYKSLRSGVILPQEFSNDLIPDFFLEPIVGRYWDITELKLPTSLLTVGRTNRDRFSHSIFEACAQLRTYANYFEDPRHREAIHRRYGILAYKPRVCVVIGRKFEVSELVRRQIELDLPWVRVLTYQDLLEKAKHRLLT